ncbi:MAG: glyceraldehyde 3-phosphate dehydrogenase, glyceraldehyde 3-phosphate dehydrogenase [Candidatus Parcubacteria bacterium]|jgi:glyceraldehyde 3-phosphate dehydrogenase
MSIKVGINGFGRIGRTFFRLAYERDDIEVVAINDLGSVDSLAYLLKYDTAYRKASFSVEVHEGRLFVDGKEIAFVQEREPSKIPWGAHGVDVVVESTGIFTSYEKAAAHLKGGAKRVVITGPVKDDAGAVPGATVLMGVNEGDMPGVAITSNASCTTNATSPLIAILHEALGVEKALLNTTHAYTASQTLQDGPSKKDLREGRAAAENIVPSSTGAAVAVTQAYPALKGKFDGISVRVPVPVGSLVDITFVSSRDTTAQEVNAILTEAASSEKWKILFGVTTEPLVSSDIIGLTFASMADLAFTRVVGGNLVKVLAWYDNEASYTHTLIEHVVASGKTLS